MKEKKLTKLYKKTSTGSIQYWQVSTQDNTIITRYGKVDGKEQETRDTISSGKNIGRSNETTPAEQAELEAKSLWDQKKKKGYVEQLDRAEVGDSDLSGGFSPMLAHKYSEQAHKIIFPALVQPKLDGIRATSDNTPRLWSRTRKPITSMPHIIEEIKRLGIQDLSLDGELYTHKLNSNFEEIGHRVRREETTAGSNDIQYHVYDHYDYGTNKERLEVLRKRIGTSKIIVLVETKLVNDHDELMDAFYEFIEKGYEGAMVRNTNAKYVTKRSYDLQKVKEFDDAEFEIDSIKEGRGKLAGHAIFICRTDNGDTFEVKLKGETAKLKELFNNEKLWRNKLLTVQYQGFTNKNNVPRFPVGLRIREDE